MIALAMIAMILSLPLYSSIAIAQLDSGQALPADAGTAALGQNLPDPAEACIEKNEKTNSLVDIMDNEFIATLEKIIRVLRAIYGVWVSVKSIWNSIIMIKYHLGLIPSAKALEEERNIINNPVSDTLGDILGYLVSCKIPSSLGSIDVCSKLSMDIGGVPVGVNPNSNIYTAAACLCLPGVLIQLKKLSTIYKAYNCCVESACRSGVSVEACERQLSEATCMFWGKGAIISGLLSALVSFITSYVYKSLVAKWVPELPWYVGTVISMANIVMEIQNLMGSLKNFEKNFQEPACSDIDLDRAKKQAQAGSLIREIGAMDRSYDGRIDTITSKVKASAVSDEERKRLSGIADLDKGRLVKQTVFQKTGSNIIIEAKPYYSLTVAGKTTYYDANEKEFTPEQFKSQVLSNSFSLSGTMVDGTCGLNGNIYSSCKFENGNLVMGSGNAQVTIPFDTLKQSDFSLPVPLDKSFNYDGQKRAFVKGNTAVKVSESEGWTKFEETTERKNLIFYRYHPSGMSAVDTADGIRVRMGAQDATFTVIGDVDAFLSSISAVGLSGLEFSSYKVTSNANGNLELEGKDSLFGIIPLGGGKATITRTSDGTSTLTTEKTEKIPQGYDSRRSFKSAIDRKVTTASTVLNLPSGQYTVTETTKSIAGSLPEEKTYSFRTPDGKASSINAETFQIVKRNPEAARAFVELGMPNGGLLWDDELNVFTNNFESGKARYKEVQVYGDGDVVTREYTQEGQPITFTKDNKGVLQRAEFAGSAFESNPNGMLERAVPIEDQNGNLIELAIDQKGKLIGRYIDDTSTLETPEWTDASSFTGVADTTITEGLNKLNAQSQNIARAAEAKRQSDINDPARRAVEEKSLKELADKYAIEEAERVFGTAVNMLIGEKVNEVIEKACKEDAKSSEPSSPVPIDSTPLSATYQFNPQTNQTQSWNICGTSQQTSYTAQSVVTHTSAYDYTSSYTVTACSRDVSFTVSLRTAASGKADIASGIAGHGKTISNQVQSSSAIEFTKICISTDDTTLQPNQEACFPIVQS